VNAPLVFMDTETTGLSIVDDIWEFAAIRREIDGTETEHHLFIRHDEALCASLPPSFREDHYDRYRDHRAYTKKQAAEYITSIFRSGKPHVVGAVPNFDTERIARLVMSQYPAWVMGWHYHLIDVENLAVGWLSALPVDDVRRAALSLPWDSNDLSRAVGIDPDQFERHTAMGDVRWAMAIYDVVTGRTS